MDKKAPPKGKAAGGKKPDPKKAAEAKKGFMAMATMANRKKK